MELGMAAAEKLLSWLRTFTYKFLAFENQAGLLMHCYLVSLGLLQPKWMKKILFLLVTVTLASTECNGSCFIRFANMWIQFLRSIKGWVFLAMPFRTTSFSFWSPVPSFLWIPKLFFLVSYELSYHSPHPPVHFRTILCIKVFLIYPVSCI